MIGQAASLLLAQAANTLAQSQPAEEAARKQPAANGQAPVAQQVAPVEEKSWRTLTGKVCAWSLAYQYLGQPLGEYAAGFAQFPPPPAANTEELLPLLMGLLGMGAMRTYEKTKGV